MNGALTALVVAGTVVGLAVVLVATATHMGNVAVAAGGVVVLLSVAAMTVGIARVEGEPHGAAESHE